MMLPEVCVVSEPIATGAGAESYPYLGAYRDSGETQVNGDG
jgi:hypothetical protein